MSMTHDKIDFGHPFRPDPDDGDDWMKAGLVLLVLVAGLLLIRLLA